MVGVADEVSTPLRLLPGGHRIPGAVFFEHGEPALLGVRPARRFRELALNVDRVADEHHSRDHVPRQKTPRILPHTSSCRRCRIPARSCPRGAGLGSRIQRCQGFDLLAPPDLGDPPHLRWRSDTLFMLRERRDPQDFTVNFTYRFISGRAPAAQ